MHAEAMRTLALIALAVVTLSGCAGTAQTTWTQGGVQCEAMPWDGDDYGGSDEERLQRLRSYYDVRGVNVQSVAIEHYDGAVPAVCGNFDGRTYVMVVTGAFPQAQEDGWQERE